MAVDSSGDAVAYRSGRWRKPTTVDRHKGLVSVSCPVATFCVAVDASGHAVIYDGYRWSSPRPVDSRAQPWSVSCATLRFCVVVDGVGNSVIYNGRDWRMGPRARTDHRSRIREVRDRLRDAAREPARQPGRPPKNSGPPDTSGQQPRITKGRG
jgi:hypothetical protein